MTDTSCRRLAEAVCIVTGGGHGVGRAIATRLAAEGARVVVLDSDVANGRATERAIDEADSPGEGKFVRASLTDEAAVKGVMRAVADEWGGIDGLVNAATETEAASLLELSEEEWDRAVAATRKGAFLCTKHAAPIMSDGGGAIVNVAAAAATGPPADAAAESSTNVAVESAERGLPDLTRRSAIELSEAGIRVNSVSLARRDGTMCQESSDDDGAVCQESGDDGALPTHANEPAAVAAATAYLLSDDAAFVTGAKIPVDAGASH